MWTWCDRGSCQFCPKLCLFHQSSDVPCEQQMQWWISPTVQTYWASCWRLGLWVPTTECGDLVVSVKSVELNCQISIWNSKFKLKFWWKFGYSDYLHNIYVILRWIHLSRPLKYHSLFISTLEVHFYTFIVIFGFRSTWLDFGFHLQSNAWMDRIVQVKKWML